MRLLSSVVVTGFDGAKTCLVHRIAYWLLLITVQQLQAGTADFVRFKPNTEYIYEFKSNTELVSVRNMTANAKVK